MTTKFSDQKMSDRMPSTLLVVTGKLCGPKKHSLKAYSGLVPMSPYTTPRAPNARRASCLPDKDLALRDKRYKLRVRESLRSSRSATMKMEMMMAADPTHQRQMAWMTNSSR